MFVLIDSCFLFWWFFYFGDLMKNDFVVSVVKVVLVVGSNFWLWLIGYDINWWVVVVMIVYIGL